MVGPARRAAHARPVVRVRRRCTPRSSHSAPAPATRCSVPPTRSWPRSCRGATRRRPGALRRRRVPGRSIRHRWRPRSPTHRRHRCDAPVGTPVRDGVHYGYRWRHGLWVVEDCSHAHGATYRGREVGSLGDAAAFSFQAAKIVYAGQGGLLASAEAEVHERACLLGGTFRVRSEQDVIRAPESALRRHRPRPELPDAPVRRRAGVAEFAGHGRADRQPSRPAGPARGGPGRHSGGLVPPTTRPGMATGAPTTAPTLRSLSGSGGSDAGADVVTEVLAAEGLDVHPPGSRPWTCCRSFRTGRYPCAGHGAPTLLPA